MELAEALSKPEILATERFLSPHEYKKLSEFEGQIISLTAAIKRGGFSLAWVRTFQVDRRPLLAVAPAFGAGSTIEMILSKGQLRFTYAGDNVLPRALRFPHWDNRYIWKCRAPRLPAEAVANTPTVGAKNPDGPRYGGTPSRDPTNPAILFEAGPYVQGDDLRPPPPHRDPALIKHLVGDLWGVLFTWELTEIEARALSVIDR